MKKAPRKKEMSACPDTTTDVRGNRMRAGESSRTRVQGVLYTLHARGEGEALAVKRAANNLRRQSRKSVNGRANREERSGARRPEAEA